MKSLYVILSEIVQYLVHLHVDGEKSRYWSDIKSYGQAILILHQ